VAVPLHHAERIVSVRHCLPSWIVSCRVLLVAAAVVMSAARVEAQSARSADIQAGFLVNFARFVSWPATHLPAAQPVLIGVVGSGAVADSLNASVKGKTIAGRAIVVKRLTALDDPRQVHLLFIGEGDRAHVAEVLRKIGGHAVLTVSDAPHFCLAGGIIQLRNEDDRIRFDINLDRAETAGLTINSKLLALAGAINPTKND